MFYSQLFIIMDGHSNISIQQWSLDGSNRQQLVGSDLVNPRSLTIDYRRDILYWLDNQHSSCVIGSYNLIDKKRGVVGPAIQRCFSQVIDFSAVSTNV